MNFNKIDHSQANTSCVIGGEKKLRNLTTHKWTQFVCLEARSSGGIWPLTCEHSLFVWRREAVAEFDHSQVNTACLFRGEKQWRNLKTHKWTQFVWLEARSSGRIRPLTSEHSLFVWRWEAVAEYDHSQVNTVCFLGARSSGGIWKLTSEHSLFVWRREAVAEFDHSQMNTGCLIGGEKQCRMFWNAPQHTVSETVYSRCRCWLYD